MDTVPNFYAVIPAHVRYCKKIEMGAKLLYGEITSLTHAQGYCWASNEYFAELYDVDISTIKRWIKSLKDGNFIAIETDKSGIHWQRKIWISPDIKKMFTKAQKCAPPGSKMSHPQLKNEPQILKKNIKEEEISPMVPAGDPPPSKRKRKSETKTEVAPEVAVTPTQKEDLVKRLGEEKAQACFQKLSIWKIGKGITGGNDYKSIHNWVIKAVNEDENKPKPEDKEKANKKLAEDIENKLPRLPDQCRIEVLHKGIEITTGRNCEVINYNDPYFKDKLTHILRKFDLDIKKFDNK